MKINLNNTNYHQISDLSIFVYSILFFERLVYSICLFNFFNHSVVAYYSTIFKKVIQISVEGFFFRGISVEECDPVNLGGFFCKVNQIPRVI